MPIAINSKAKKYLGDGSVMTGTRHKKSAMKIMNNGIHNGTWKKKKKNYYFNRANDD
jgi:hypothetical protein